MRARKSRSSCVSRFGSPYYYCGLVVGRECHDKANRQNTVRGEGGEREMPNSPGMGGRGRGERVWYAIILNRAAHGRTAAFHASRPHDERRTPELPRPTTGSGPRKCVLVSSCAECGVAQDQTCQARSPLPAKDAGPGPRFRQAGWGRIKPADEEKR